MQQFEIFWGYQIHTYTLKTIVKFETWISVSQQQSLLLVHGANKTFYLCCMFLKGFTSMEAFQKHQTQIKSQN